MEPVTEITLDFDNTVSTEERFTIRHFIEDFVEIVNNQPQEVLSGMISDAAVAEGFSEFSFQKPQILEMFYKKFFGRRKNYISFSKLKLSLNKLLFHVQGGYEEYHEEILAAAGTIDLSLVKVDDRYEFVSFRFYPRMRMPLPDTEQYG